MFAATAPSHASVRSKRSGASRSVRTHASSGTHHHASRSIGDPAEMGEQPTYIAPSRSSRRRSGRPGGSGSAAGGFPEPTSFGGGSSPPDRTPFGHGMVPGKTLFLPLQVHGKAKGHLHVPADTYVDISRPVNQKGRKGRIDLLPVRAGSQGESPEPIVSVAQHGRGSRTTQELSNDLSTLSPVRVRGPNVLEIAVPARIVVSITEPAVGAGETAQRSYFIPLVKPKPPRQEHSNFSPDDSRAGGVAEGGQMDARPPMRLYGPTTVEVHAPAGTFVDISRPRNVKGKKGRINLLPGDGSNGGRGGIQTFPEDDYEDALPTRAPHMQAQAHSTPPHLRAADSRSLAAHEAPLHDIPLLPESPPPVPMKPKSPKLGFFGTIRRKLTRSKTVKSRMSDLPTHYEDPNFQAGELEPQHSIRTASHHPADISAHTHNTVGFEAPPVGVHPEARSPTVRSAATLHEIVQSPQPMSVRTESIPPSPSPTPKRSLFGTIKRRLTRKSTRRTAMTSIRQPSKAASSHRTSVREREARDAQGLTDMDRAVSRFDFEMEERELDLDPDEVERHGTRSTRGLPRRGTASTRVRTHRTGTTSTLGPPAPPFHDSDMDHFNVIRAQDRTDSLEAEELRREMESGMARDRGAVLGAPGHDGDSDITGRNSLELEEAPPKRRRIWRRKTKGKKQPTQFRPSPPPSESDADDEAHWCICC